jgi:hypothetical protein
VWCVYMTHTNMNARVVLMSDPSLGVFFFFSVALFEALERFETGP